MPDQNETDNNSNGQQTPPLNHVLEEPIESRPITNIISPSRSPKSKAWLWVIMVLAVLLAGAYIASVLSRTTDKKTDTTKTPSVTSKNTSKSPEAEISSPANLLSQLQTSVKGGETSSEERAPDYMVKGYDFYAIARVEDTASIIYKKPKSELKATAESIASYLASQGFQKSAQQVKDPYYPLVKYENDTVFCGINYYEDTVESLHELYVACAQKESYVATAKLQKPFYDSYRADSIYSKDLTDDSRLGYPKVANSQTAGYKTAEAAIYTEANPTGAVGLFYQTPDGNWHFFRGTQIQLGCSEYSTPDVKKAYAGTKCLLLPADGVSDTESTVKP